MLQPLHIVVCYCFRGEKKILNRKHLLKPILFYKYCFFLVTGLHKTQNPDPKAKLILSEIIFRQIVQKEPKFRKNLVRGQYEIYDFTENTHNRKMHIIFTEKIKSFKKLLTVHCID